VTRTRGGGRTALWGQNPAHPPKTGHLSHTVFEHKFQESTAAREKLSLAEAAGLSELRGSSGLGTRICGSLFRRLYRATVDEALPLPGLWSGTHPAALQPLAGFLGAVAADPGLPAGQAQGAALELAHPSPAATVLEVDRLSIRRSWVKAWRRPSDLRQMAQDLPELLRFGGHREDAHR
jgi:hypothetical protein